MSVKSRPCDIINTVAGVETTYSYPSGAPSGSNVYRLNTHGFEELSSKGNRFPPKGYGDFGSGFFKRKQTWIHKPARNIYPYKYYAPTKVIAADYVGDIYTNDGRFASYGYSDLPAVANKLTVNQYGVEAWAKFKPTASQGQLGQAIAELHDVRSLFHIDRVYSGLSAFRALGKSYLRVEFGWRPFLNDVKDFLRNTLNTNERLNQLARDNGRNVRRRGHLNKTETGSTETSRTASAWPGLELFNAGVPTRFVTKHSSKDRWFSASFRYYIPPKRTNRGPSEEYMARQQMTRIIYGLDLSPSLVWELMPWSWLADWGSNIGANLSNLNDSQDNLVAMYAYLMQSDIQTETYVARGEYFKGLSTEPYEASSVFIREVKQRDPASAFGFGLTLPDLSLKQSAILAALGLSRVR